VISISGVRGRRDQTEDRVKTLVVQESSITAKVVVASATPPRARTLFAKWRGSPTEQLPNESDETTDLQIRIILPERPNSQLEESEVIARLGMEFPTASITVRHATQRL